MIDACRNGRHRDIAVCIETREALVNWLDDSCAVRRDFLELILGCGVGGSWDVPPVRCRQLAKLRSSGLTEARVRLADYSGVRRGVEAARIKAARSEVRAAQA